jgi:hypothetical protein
MRARYLRALGLSIAAIGSFSCLTFGGSGIWLAGIGVTVPSNALLRRRRRTTARRHEGSRTD